MSTNLLNNIVDRLERIENKLDRALYEDEGQEYEAQRTYTPEEIIKQGQRVAYNKISDANDIVGFKQFLYYIATHARDFNQKEVDYARFADKAFEDVRLSDNHVRILQGAYMKVHGKLWSYRMVKGYMYKYNEQIAWEWMD